MKRIYFIFVAIIITLSTASIICAEEASGFVFEDLNKNLKRDAGEKGVAGVLVSNGREVVKTNENGAYVLPAAMDEAVFFITKPANYALPVDENNLPQFYYIHRPEGSPSLKYNGVDPTDPLPESIDFPLFKSEYTESFDVVVFGDPQPYNSREVDYIRDDIIPELIGVDAAFGITLGDILGNTLSLYEEYNPVVGKIGVPFYNVPGNHDLNFDVPDDRYSLETFTRHFGPTYYSFNHGKVHFVILDDIEWHGKKGDKKGYYKGAVSDEQLEWLNNDLKYVDPDKLIVFSMHIPLKTMRGATEVRYIKNTRPFFELLEGRKHALLLAAHTHTLEHHYMDEKDGWKGGNELHQIICATVCGSWWSGPEDTRGIPVADMSDGTPNGYHIFHFDGNQYSETFKAADKDRNFQMRISTPKGILTRKELEQSRILVNVFDGGVKSTVECRVDQEYPVKMKRTIRTDPFIVELYEQYEDSMKSWVNPRRSTHIWTAPLPRDLESGLHVISVTSTDQYGREHKGYRLFEVE